jgi:hypothetical protein
MDHRLQAYLDGDLPLDGLPSELRREAEAWEALLTEMRAMAPEGAPAGLDTRVRAAVGGQRPAWLDWLFRPRPVPVPPAAVLAAAALVLVLVLPFGSPGPAEDDDLRFYVQFVVDAPTAETVHVVGDFNDWQPTVALEDPDGDGTWSSRVPLRPGVHQYMFVIDGADWITDPNASSFQDDGFGQRNAVVAVSPLDGT